jgi:hypothetical protein
LLPSLKRGGGVGQHDGDWVNDWLGEFQYCHIVKVASERLTDVVLRYLVRIIFCNNKTIDTREEKRTFEGLSRAA